MSRAQTHSAAKKSTVRRFLKTVFHTLKGQDGLKEHIFLSQHDRHLPSTGAWPYTALDDLLEGSEFDTYHFCTCTVNKPAPNSAPSRRLEGFNRLHVIILDGIGDKVLPNDLKPTYIIQTAKDTYQWGYVLKQPIADLGAANKFVRAVYEKAWLTDQSAAMPNRLARLPLGRNLAPGKDAFQVRLVELNPDTRYSPVDLVNAWGLSVDASALAKLRTEGEKLAVVDELFEYMKSNGHIFGTAGEDSFKVECPMWEEHPDGNPYGAYKPLGKGEDPHQRRFTCDHAHKAGDPPDIKEFLIYMAALGAPHVSASAPIELTEPELGFLPLNESIPDENFPDIAMKQNGNISIKKTVGNLEYLLDRYGFKCHFNVISKRTEVLHYTDVEGMDSLGGVHTSKTARITSQCALNGLSLSANVTKNYLLCIADKRLYNPVVEFFETLKINLADERYAVHAKACCERQGIPYDPKNLDIEKLDFVKLLADTIDLEPETPREALETFLHLWLIQCVAASDAAERTNNPDALCRFESVFTLIGPVNVKKTAWFRALIPEELGQYFTDGVSFALAGRNHVENSLSHFIVELGNLNHLGFPGNLQKGKDFLTSSKDSLQEPGRSATYYKRRTSFCATVENELIAETASKMRQFWSIHTCGLETPDKYLVLCVWQQVWREYLAGKKWWLDPGDENDSKKLDSWLGERVVNYRPPEIEKIEAVFGPLTLERATDVNNSLWLTTREICERAGMKIPTILGLRTVSKMILEQYPAGAEDVLKRKFRHNVTKYRMPLPLDERKD